MSRMEDDLKQRNETLWSAFKHTYDIALKQWLALMVNQNASANSLPHLLGVMEQVDMLLYSGKYVEVALSDMELYILLCSIMLHDFGKASSFCDTKNKGVNGICDWYKQLGCEFCVCEEGVRDHCDGCKHKDKFKNQHNKISCYSISKKWQYFGLLNEKIAKIIGIVCCFHDCKHTKDCRVINNEYYLEGYGRIHARILAVLLYLGDHLDDTFKRTAPEFVSQLSGVEEICTYRNKVQYILIDKQNKMICSVLDKSLWIKNEDFKGEEYFENDVSKKEFICINRLMKGENILRDYLTDWEWNEDKNPYIESSQFASLVAHVNENNTEILRVNNELHILNMPIKKWLISCNGHLFEPEYKDATILCDEGKCPNYSVCKENQRLGAQKLRQFTKMKYAIEPTLDTFYLDRIYAAMLRISKCIFGRRAFTYYELLNYIYEFGDNIIKVKTAVNRIRQILDFCYLKQKHEGTIEFNPYEVYCNDNIWMLKKRKSDSDFKPIGNILKLYCDDNIWMLKKRESESIGDILNYINGEDKS